MRHREHMTSFSTDKVHLYALDKCCTISYDAFSQIEWKLHPVVVEYSDISFQDHCSISFSLLTVF